MGYVNDTNMSQFISPFQIAKTAGTWTPTLASNVAYDLRTAADVDFTLLVPIKIPSNASGLKGAYLKSIDLWWSNATADLNAVATVALSKVALPANTVAPTGGSVTITADVDNDTTAERLTQAEHHMVVTLTTPVWIDDDEAFVLSMVVDPGANSVFKLYGARANFTLRV
jgi:hypothetical protein